MINPQDVAVIEKQISEAFAGLESKKREVHDRIRSTALSLAYLYRQDLPEVLLLKKQDGGDDHHLTQYYYEYEYLSRHHIFQRVHRTYGLGLGSAWLKEEESPVIITDIDWLEFGPLLVKAIRKFSDQPPTT